MPKTPVISQIKLFYSQARPAVSVSQQQKYSREGANVIVADINSDGAAAVAETLSDAHVDAKAITGDVAD